MWMTISLILAFILLVSWAMIAMLLGLTKMGRPWRVRARSLASWSGVVMALGVFLLEPHFFVGDAWLQWLMVAMLAMMIGEGSLYIVGWLVTRVLRHAEEQAERHKI